MCKIIFLREISINQNLGYVNNFLKFVLNLYNLIDNLQYLCYYIQIKGKQMKLFGIDAKEKDHGYFGVRKCEVCGDFRDVNLIEVVGTERFFAIPLKKLGTRRFLACARCGACFEVNKDLWNYYCGYKYRFNKETTDQVLSTLKQIDDDLKSNNVSLKFDDKIYEHSINLMFKNLCKKFNNPENVEEIMSVYFSGRAQN